MARLYIEALIRTDMESLWQRTQDPSAHQRWDLRFTRIEYAVRTGGSQRRPRAAAHTSEAAS